MSIHKVFNLNYIFEKIIIISFPSVLLGLSLVLSSWAQDASHPDQVFPIPSNFGQTNDAGVNLLTGNVNLTIPLVSISGVNLDYTLNAFYNSRSADLPFADNTLGANGWKLLDYPKIVQEGDNYYFLDGHISYQMREFSSRYVINGAYHLWRITPSGTGASMVWNITTDAGIQYILKKQSSNSAYAFWHLSEMKNPNYSESILFNYTNGNLQSITNALNEKWRLLYANKHLIEIDYYQDAKNPTPTDKVVLEMGNTPKILSAIQVLHKLPTGDFAPQTASTKFTYYPATKGNELKNALNTVTFPGGEIRAYSYHTGTKIGKHHPVIRYDTDNGYPNNRVSNECPLDDTCSAIWYEDWLNGADTYAQFNTVKEYPGGLPKGDGSSEPTDDPYGHTVHQFFNGRPSSKLKQFPKQCNRGDDATNPVLRGLSYRVQNFRRGDTVVSDDSFCWTIHTNYSQWALLTSSQVSLDQVDPSTTNYHYNDIGLLKEVRTTRRNPKPGGGASVNTDNIKTSIIYAYERYPALNADNLNILAIPAQVTNSVLEPGKGAWKITGSETMQWAHYGGAENGYWAPYNTYVLQKEISTSTLSQAFKAPPPSDWLRIQELGSRAPNSGRVTEVKNVDDVISAAVYDTSYHVYPVFSIGNVNVYDNTENEAGYYGFEEYESSTNWSISSGQTTEESAHTGKQSSKGNSSISPKDFIPRVRASAYMISAYIKISAAGSDCTIGFKNGNTWVDKKKTVSHNTTLSGWNYAQVTDDAPSQKKIPTIQCTGSDAYVDDIRFAPIDSPFSATIYDWDSKLPTATLGANGETIRIAYDAFNIPVGIIGPNEQAKSASVAYFSPLGNQWFQGEDTFEPHNPNAVLAAVAQTSGMWDGFAFESETNFTNYKKMKVQGGLLRADGNVSSYSEASATFVPANKTIPENFIFQTEVLMPPKPVGGSSAPEIGIILRYGTKAMKFVFKEYMKSEYGFALYDNTGTNKTVSLKNIHPAMILSLVILEGKHLSAYAQGRLLFTHTFDTKAQGSIDLISAIPGSAFDNVFFLIDPVLSKTVMDAVGQPKQTITQEGPQSILITENLYGGDLDLTLAQTKMTRLMGNMYRGLSFMPDFVKDFSSNPISIGGGDVQQAWPNYKTTPFSVSQADQFNPLLRTSESGSGGIYTADQHGTDTDYRKNQGYYFPFQKGQLETTVNTTPDKKLEQFYTNRFDTPFADVTIARNGDHLKQQYAYNASADLTRSYAPNFFDSSVEKNNHFFNQNRYNFLGRVTYKETPDAGIKQYGYDRSGRLRLLLDARGREYENNQYKYWKYDDTGRRTEEGLYQPDCAELGTIDLSQTSEYDSTICPMKVQGALSSGKHKSLLAPSLAFDTRTSIDIGATLAVETGFPNIDDSSFPPEGEYTKWKKKYQYDGNKDGESQGLIGRLVSIETPETMDSHRYDSEGRVQVITQNIGAEVESIFQYKYNQVGQVTEIRGLNNLDENIPPIDVVVGADDKRSSIAALDIIELESGYSPPNGGVVLKAGVAITMDTGIYVNKGTTLSAEIDTGVYHVTYAYDHAGRLSDIGLRTNPDQYASYSYGNGIVTEALHDGRLIKTYTMNAAGRISDITVKGTDGTLYFQEILCYDKRYQTGKGCTGNQGYYDGRIASAHYGGWKGADYNYTYQYTYDAFGRLTQAEYSNSAGAKVESKSISLTYDANGNIEEKTTGNNRKEYSYVSGTNQISQQSRIRYDANGNIIETPDIRADYDEFTGLTTSMVKKGLESLQDSKYDGYDRKVNKSVLNKRRYHYSRRYHYGLSTMPLMETQQLSPLKYVYGQFGLIAMWQDGEEFTILGDHLGSTRMVLRDNNIVDARFNYTPFGDFLAEQRGSADIRYLYTGQEYDKETGLYNYHARMYDSDLGRFYAVDPIPEYPSPYAYVGNNPISFTDPSGQLRVPYILAAGRSTGKVAQAIIFSAITSVGFEGLSAWITGEDFNLKEAGTVVGFSVARSFVSAIIREVVHAELLYRSATTAGTGREINTLRNRLFISDALRSLVLANTVAAGVYFTSSEKRDPATFFGVVNGSVAFGLLFGPIIKYYRSEINNRCVQYLVGRGSGKDGVILKVSGAYEFFGPQRRYCVVTPNNPANGNVLVGLGTYHVAGLIDVSDYDGGPDWTTGALLQASGFGGAFKRAFIKFAVPKFIGTAVNIGALSAGSE